MGWFIGIIPENGALSETGQEHVRQQMLNAAGSKPLYSFASEQIVVLAGGLPELLNFKAPDKNFDGSGWLVCGLGITGDVSSPSFMHETDWNSILRDESAEDKLQNVGGHFAAVTWNSRGVELFCDCFELAKVYVSSVGDHRVFSTRLEWLVKLLPDPELDYDELASGWTLINSLSDRSYIKGVKHLGPSGHYSVIDRRTQHSWHHWRPHACNEIDVQAAIKNLALLPIREERRLTLGLSGGIDSRTLLATLLDAPRDSWQVHSMGDESNPDILVASMLAEEFRLNHRIHYYRLDDQQDASVLASNLRDYALATEMSDSPFGLPKLELFDEMKEQDCWMIDGAYGELILRSYGHTLVPAVRTALRTGNYEPMIDRLAARRSPFFANDVVETFERKTRSQIANAIDEMPGELRGEPEEWIDLFHLRYRLKNYAGGSQWLYDSHIPNYMPFVHPTLLNAAFDLPVRNRSNNKINRRMISKSDRRLTRIPLLSYGVMVPYWTSRNISASRLIGKMRREIFGRKQLTARSYRLSALAYLRDFVLDRVRSRRVKGCGYYNNERLEKLIENFYIQPDESSAQVIDDWLTFDFWVERVSSESSRVKLG